MEYTSATLISNFLKRSLTADETASLVVIIPAVRQWIDRRLSTTFLQVGSTTRYFDGGEGNIDIDPVTEITNIGTVQDDGTTDNTYTQGTEYVLEPQNETVKREIRKRFGLFPRGAGRVAVTGKFSEYDGGIPQDIQVMATRLAAGILNSGNAISQGGNIKMEELEGHKVMYKDNSTTIEGLVTEDPTVMAIIESREGLMIDNYEPASRNIDYSDEGPYV